MRTRMDGSVSSEDESDYSDTSLRMEEGDRKRARMDESTSSEDEIEKSCIQRYKNRVDQFNATDSLLSEAIRDLDSLTDEQVNNMVNRALSAFLETMNPKGSAYEQAARSVIESCIRNADGRVGLVNVNDFLDKYPDFLATAESRKAALIRE
mgnify:CR=1 FL=1